MSRTQANGRNGFSASTYPDVARPGSVAALSAPTLAAASVLRFQPVDGTWIYVESIKDYVYFDANAPTLAVDGITVVPSYLGGATRLIRADIPHPFWSTQGSWGINPTTGNDENVGSPASPLKTHAELQRRIGTGKFVLRQNTFVQILGDLPATDPISGTYIVGSGVMLGWQGGVKTVLYSGSVTGVTAQNRATNTPLQVTDAAIVDWTPFVGHRVRNTGAAANNNGIAWVRRVDSVTSVKAHFSSPAKMFAPPMTQLNFQAVTPSTFSLADTFNIEQLFSAHIGALQVVPEFGNDVGFTFPFTGFVDLELAGGDSGDFVCPRYGTAFCNYHACRFTSGLLIADPGSVGVLNCGLIQGMTIGGGAGAAIVLEAGCAYGVFACFAQGPCTLQLDQDFTTQGGGIILSSGAQAVIGFAAAFDTIVEPSLNPLGAGLCIGGTLTVGGVAAGAGIHTLFGAGHALWGAGNQIGVHVGTFCALKYDPLGGGPLPMTIAGNGANSDFRLGNAAAGVQAIDPGGAAIGPNNQTWANLVAARPGGFGGFASNPLNLATIAVAA